MSKAATPWHIVAEESGDACIKDAAGQIVVDFDRDDMTFWADIVAAVNAVHSLLDPVAVRVNILLGTIAKPDDLVWRKDELGEFQTMKAERDRLRGALDEATQIMHAAQILARALTEPSTHKDMSSVHIFAHCIELERRSRAFIKGQR